MSNLIEDVANQAIDAAGIDDSLGDLGNPSRVAQVVLRAYAQCRRQLLRAAHWNCARRQAQLTMLADATGQTANVGNSVPPPWIYSYALPMDSVKIRYVMWNNYPQGANNPPGNIVPPDSGASLMTGLTAPPINNVVTRPARFLVGTDYNNPPPQPLPDEWWEQQGISPTSRAVILTNVFQPQCIYTVDMIYPNMWDSRFRAALVAFTASEIALPLAKDKAFGMKMQAQNIAIAKDKIMQARISDGDEGWGNVDNVPDWIRTRQSGGAGNGYSGVPGWGGAYGQGIMCGGWDSISFAGNTSAF